VNKQLKPAPEAIAIIAIIIAIARAIVRARAIAL